MELNPKHKEFADEYIDTGNATKSVKEVFDIENDNVAANKGHRLLRNAKIREYLADKAETAASIVFELAKGATNENVRLGASKDILDRAGFKPVEKTDITTKGEKINDTSEKIKELASKLNDVLKSGDK